MTQSSSDYLLGVNQTELERLRFQHTVWGHVTRKFFDRILVRQGWKCLDVGAGPGFVSMDLRNLVGASGEVTALEPSELFLNWFKNECATNKWTNIKFIQGSAEQAEIPQRQYDFIFARWVIAFVPDPEKFLAPLFRALKPGGIIALQDYYYEGLSLFPHGGAWDTMADVVRSYYRFAGGDAYVTGTIPAIFRKNGLKLIDFTPTSIAGGPDSAVMEWAHRFFRTHTQLMADKKIITQQECDALTADWEAHRQNPDTIFFSPIVVDVAGALS